DRAFAARAAAASFADARAQFAAPGAKGLGAQRPAWTPQEAHVSTRGDMGWTYGRQGEGGYVTVWERDMDGAWKAAAFGR
ncbi:MAG: hypothetical protein AB7L65_09115, partial [Hyphomonadaceae bacterium]